ncbi:MAG: 2-hydroxyacyl-CoA dehydratase [Chloroflexi bacterium]|nr:2-hydroxyacyl-CoA dehydratase [Chloroflexota bacterium]
MGTAIDTSTGKISQLIRYMKFLTTFYRNQPHAHYFRMLQDYFIALRDARANGGFVVAHTIFFPVEIFDALDLVPMHLEFTGSLMSFFGIECGDLLAGAAEMGLPPEVCSAHRVIAGALKASAMPQANAVVCSNLVCDNAMKSGELTMALHSCPGFVFDYPFNQGEAADRAIMQELKDVIAFLENVSGHKMDWHRLSANIAETNRQIGLVREVNNLCKAVPSPLPPQDFLKFLVVDYMGAGKPETTLYLQSLRDDLAAKVAAGKGFVNPERLRLMATMLSPWYLQGTIDAILSEHGAAIVCNPNLCDWRQSLQLDPARPLESIAMKLAACSPMRMFGPLDERALGPLRDCVREYRINGAINFNHLGCRQIGPTFKIYKDILDELDVPILYMDCDLIDPTVTSADEVRQKLEQFFELLEDR